MMKGISTSDCILKKESDGGPSIEKGVEMLAEAGFRFVDLSRDPGELPRWAAALEAHGMAIWAIHGKLSGHAISADDAERRQAIGNELARMAHFAPYAADSAKVAAATTAGPVPYVIHWLSRHRDPAVGDIWRRTIEEMLPKAESLGINLALETMPYKPEVHERYVNTQEIADFVRSFDSEFLSICMDVNHSNLNENLEEAIGNCAGIISHIHVADNHGEREEHLPPGKGIIDFRRAWAALVKAGYEGPLNLECVVSEQPTVAELATLREWAEVIAACEQA